MNHIDNQKLASEPQTTNVVIADDDQRMTRLLEQHLVRLGYRVVGVATNGQNAVDLVSRVRPGLVFMDIEMPVRDGIDAAREILEKQSVPIIFSTGSASDANLQRLEGVPVGGYLIKPFSLAQLKVAIRVALDQHQLAER